MQLLHRSHRGNLCMQSKRGGFFSKSCCLPVWIF